MAALPLTHPDLDGPGVLLAALEANHGVLAGAEVAQFEMATEWAAHPVDDLDDAATVEGTEGELAIAGPGAPLVAEFCVADFALAVGLTTYAGRDYLGDAVEVRYRLPRLWERVMAGQVAVWRARKIARQTMSLPLEGAEHVDRHLAPVAHRLTWAQLERTVEAARATFDPVEAEHRRLLAAEGRFFDVDTHTPSLAGTTTVRGELDLADALDLDHALTVGAQRLADLGCAETLDVRRAMAAGALARGDLMLPCRVAQSRSRPQSLGSSSSTPTCPRKPWLVWRTPAPMCSWARSRAGAPPPPAPSASARCWIWVSTSRCPATHVNPWDQGGPTCSCNLVPACRFHHRLKTRGGWRLERVGHRLFTWTSPHGRTYTRHT
ncbi:DUF222 domain-containing protein [Nocardioides sp.]|uniref:HNH endonuclease signature motif containing protein n=1 Tax=Nocardioides sp. TaxID=35761 RepID=UPI002ED8791C